MNSRPTIWKRFLSLVLTVGILLSSSAVVTSASALGNEIEDAVSDIATRLEDVTGLFGNDRFRDNAFNSSVTKNNIDPDGKYWIFIDLEDDSISDHYEKEDRRDNLIDYANSSEAEEIRQNLKEKQEALLSDLSASGIEYTYKYSYTLLSNAVAVQVTYRDVEKIRGLAGVKSVSLSERYLEPKEVTNDARVWGTGIYKTEGIDYDGNGLVVAVLDTGLDSSHAAFRTMPTVRTGGKYLTRDEVARLVFGGTSGGLHDIDGGKTSPDDVYYNSKVPFAYDYADKDSIVYPSYSTHGTHVAGIIAGNLGDKADEPIRDSDGNIIRGDDGEPLTFRGVAPEAQLVICKVFTDRENSESLGGAETVDILAALEDCVKLGVDVINMSLGSSCGFSTKDDERMDRVYSSIRATGISLVVAASNDYSSAYGSNSGTNLTDNPDSATVGAPSTFEEALSVASINGQKSPYLVANKGTSAASDVYFTEASDGNGNPKEFVKELLAAQNKGSDEELTLDYVLVGLYGRTAGYTGINASGKIAVIQRGGEMTFEEKVNIARSFGAVGVIIYNNVSGIIRMSLGSATAVPTCSVTMDEAQSLLKNADPVTKTGTITVKKTQVAGPFMSDFSSWGPTPTLHLKPEITAHGGEITSAVPGGWDEYSGTSMAAPNMAGAMSLVLQYLTEKGYTDKNERLTLANRLVMSATTIAYDQYNTPYSPRKQGAGLATIKNAIETLAFLKVDGTDKTKLELGDDKTKTGVYELVFDLVNYGDAAKTYDLSTLTMTETVASDGRTVAEHAYMLDALCSFAYTVNGLQSEGRITVAAGESVKIGVTVTLGSEARSYLDANFKNGMYVEGFVRLVDTASDNAIDLSIPWLAFYGDWSDAPMFDLSAYDVARAEQDDSIPDEEKPQASVYATIPLGSYNNNQYIIPLGSYLYTIPDSMNKVIYADEDKIAISMYDETNHRTVYKLYAVYAGLLRGASTMDIRITDNATGEILYKEVKANVRKAYSGGSTTARASLIELEIDPAALGLANNRKYTFEMAGRKAGVLDGDAPAQQKNDTFTFTFYVDTEAPEIVNYRIRFDAYKEGKETKYKVLLDVDVYDNHYAQALALCYLNVDENELALLTGDMIPLESSRGGVTTVTVDVTDYYYTGTDIYLQVDDYALNTRAYRIKNISKSGTLADFVNYPTSVSFVDGETVTIDQNEAKLLSLAVEPSDAAVTGLYWTTSDKRVVQVKDGTIFGVKEGEAVVTVYAGTDASASVKQTIRVRVTDRIASAVKIKNLTYGLIYNGDSELVDPTNTTVEVNPNMTFRLNVNVNPWYFTGDLDIRFSSSASDVATVEEKTGVVRTLREGTATITATRYVNGKATASAVSVILSVGPEFDVRNGTLYGYHGLGGKVTIPKSLNVYYIDEEAFKDNNTITELEISSPCTEIHVAAFDHMTALERVIIPDTVSFVATGAFRNCPKLKQVDLRSRAITFSTRCFENCTSLQAINNMVVTDPAVDTKTAELLTLTEAQFERTAPHIGTLGSEAFRGCTALEKIDLTLLRVSGDSVFSGCTSLREVTLSEHTAIGNAMFEDCSSLSKLVFTDTGKFDFSGALVPFSGCSLSEFVFPEGAETYYFDEATGAFYTDETHTTLVFAMQTIGSFTAPASLKTILPGAFAGSRKLTRITLDGVESIGDYAFADCSAKGFTSVTVPASVTYMGAGVFYNCSYLNSASVRANIAALPAATFALSGLSSVTLGDTITALGDKAFYFTDFVDLDLRSSKVNTLGDYVFGNPYRLKTVKLPALTKVGYGTFAHVYDSAMTEVYPLSSVEFADGTTDIGSGTFYGTTGYPSLTSVLLPDSVRDNVTVIGRNTFRGCTNLAYLNLGTLTRIGDNAFRGCENLGKNGNPGFTTGDVTSVGSHAFDGCAAIAALDLSKAETVGDGAFLGTALTAADLSSCVHIGASAFRGTPLASLTVSDRLETLGSYAFAGTDLSGTFTFPASLSDAKGAIGYNPFYGTSVTAFAMTGDNSRYFVRDGVLYERIESGVQLVAYPSAKEDASFTVPSDVVRIGEEAFRGAEHLASVTLPQGLVAIGDKAFYDSAVKAYTFTGLSAPILEAYAFRNSDSSDKVLQDIFDFQSGEGEEKYYANFSDYLAKILYEKKTGVSDLGLTLSFPDNAKGFDTRLWKLYFSTVNRTATLPEPDTEAAIAAIDAMPSAEAIRALTSMADKEAAKEQLTACRALVSAARRAYNRVTDSAQLAFITRANDLFATEAVVREVRKAFGETVSIADLLVSHSPDKLTYVDGESFDAAGLRLTVVYDDGSRDEVSEGFVLPTTPLKAGQQTVTFTYAGVSKTISVVVNRNPNANPDPSDPTDPVNPADPTDPEKPKNNTALIVILSVTGGVLVLGGAGVGVYFYLKKKKRTDD